MGGTHLCDAAALEARIFFMGRPRRTPYTAPFMKIADSNARVLVTGGAGFIGSHLVDFLVGKGCHVTVLDNFRNGKSENLADAAKSG